MTQPLREVAHLMMTTGMGELQARNQLRDERMFARMSAADHRRNLEFFK